MKIFKKLSSFMLASIMVLSLCGAFSVSADDTTPNFLVPEWTEDFESYTTDVITNAYSNTDCTFKKAAFVEATGSNSDNESKIITDGENKVLSIGPTKSAWSTEWDFTKKPVKDSFKISFKMKIPEYDWVDDVNSGKQLWQLRFKNGKNNGKNVQRLYLRGYKGEEGGFLKYTLSAETNDNDSSFTSSAGIASDKLKENSVATKDWILIEAELDKATETIKVYIDKELALTQKLCLLNQNSVADEFTVTNIELAKRDSDTIKVCTYFDDFKFYDATYGDVVTLPEIKVGKNQKAPMTSSYDEGGAQKTIKWENGGVADTSVSGSRTYYGKTDDVAYKQQVTVGTDADVLIAKDEMSHTNTSNGAEATLQGMKLKFTATNGATASSVNLGNGNYALSIGSKQLDSEYMRYDLDNLLTGNYTMNFKLKVNSWKEGTKGAGINIYLYNKIGTTGRIAGGYFQMPDLYKNVKTNYLFRDYNAVTGEGSNSTAISTILPLTEKSSGEYNTDWFTFKIVANATSKKFAYYINDTFIKEVGTLYDDTTDLYGFSIRKQSKDTILSEFYIDEITIVQNGEPTFYNAPETEMNITVGQGDIVDTTVEVSKTDGTTEKRTLKGVNVDTSKLGTTTYTGYIDGFDTPINLTVTVCNFDISGLVFEDADGQVVDAPEVGDSLASATVKRYGNIGNATAIFAYYESGVLQSAKIVPISDIDKNNTDTLEIGMSLGDKVTDNGVIRAFVMDEMSNIKPIDLSKTFTVNSFFQ